MIHVMGSGSANIVGMMILMKKLRHVSAYVAGRMSVPRCSSLFQSKQMMKEGLRWLAKQPATFRRILFRLTMAVPMILVMWPVGV
jgi:hypothetical protein